LRSGRFTVSASILADVATVISRYGVSRWLGLSQLLRGALYTLQITTQMIRQHERNRSYLSPFLSHDFSLSSCLGAKIDPLPGSGIDRMLLADFRDPLPRNILSAARPIAPRAANLRKDLRLPSASPKVS